MGNCHPGKQHSFCPSSAVPKACVFFCFFVLVYHLIFFISVVMLIEHRLCAGCWKDSGMNFMQFLF